MPLAYWCVLIAALLPIAIVTYAKSVPGSDNHNPRDAIDTLPPPKRRAYAAHLNAYENFPFFAAAVIVAVTQGASLTTVNILSTAYVGARVAHAVFYVADLATARSAAFTAGFFLTIAIFVLPVFS